jgi:hypothetical protein
MKQLLSLFLFLLPCLALAQYPSNGNQKITLGEQTTADGLIFRGVASDTTLTAKSDTAAYFVLDTANLNLYTYKASATGKKWIQLGSDTTSLNLVSRFATKLNISDTASMLTPYWRSGRFSGILPVANGGTNTSTAFTSGSVVFAGSGGTYTQDNSGLFFNSTDNRLGINNPSPVAALDVTGSQMLRTSSNTVMLSSVILNTFETTPGIPNNDNLNFRMYGRGATSETLLGNNTLGNAFFYAASNTGTPSISIGTTTNAPLYFATNNLRRLTINSAGAVTIANLAAAGVPRAVNADVNGTLSASSSILIKENVENINYGLSDVLKLKPVSFNYIDKEKWGDGKDLGFVAEDVMNIIPESTGVMNTSDIYHDMTKLIPILTKAIQEQQALIKALEQRIINLENK